MTVDIICADVTEGLARFPDGHFDAVVTDPPYGLEFMGKEWDKLTWNAEVSHKGKERERGANITSHDYGMRICRGINRVIGGREAQAFHEAWATAALRVLKPGGHLVAFGGTRTHHRLWCALEDAGFEVRDTLCWLYGSGFPKSLRVSRDERFCQCGVGSGASEHSGAHIGAEPYEVAHTNTEAPSALRGVGAPPPSAQSERDKSLDSLGDYRSSPRSGDEQPHQAVVSDPASPLLQGDAQGRNRSTGADDGRGAREQTQGPLSHTDRPSMQDSSRPTGLGLPCHYCSKPIANGLGTALKPAWEPIVLARKPLVGTVAANVQAHGTGALNVDGCRVEASNRRSPCGADGRVHRTTGSVYGEATTGERFDLAAGRWPANVVLECTCEETRQARVQSKATSHSDGRSSWFGGKAGESEEGYADPDGKEAVEVHTDPDCPAAMLDAQSGELQSGLMRGGTRRAAQNKPGSVCYGIYGGDATAVDTPADSGGASRFFYCAKASRAERGKGNNHPTVKPLALMRWLVRLVTPPGGLILDPFLGSGTTAVAAIAEGFRCVGIDSNPEYCEMARHRTAQMGLMTSGGK